MRGHEGIWVTVSQAEGHHKGQLVLSSGLESGEKPQDTQKTVERPRARAGAQGSHPTPGAWSALRPGSGGRHGRVLRLGPRGPELTGLTSGHASPPAPWASRSRLGWKAQMERSSAGPARLHHWPAKPSRAAWRATFSAGPSVDSSL